MHMTLATSPLLCVPAKNPGEDEADGRHETQGTGDSCEVEGKAIIAAEGRLVGCKHCELDQDANGCKETGNEQPKIAEQSSETV